MWASEVVPAAKIRPAPSGATAVACAPAGRAAAGIHGVQANEETKIRALAPIPVSAITRKAEASVIMRRTFGAGSPLTHGCHVVPPSYDAKGPAPMAATASSPFSA